MNGGGFGQKVAQGDKWEAGDVLWYIWCSEIAAAGLGRHNYGDVTNIADYALVTPVATGSVAKGACDHRSQSLIETIVFKDWSITPVLEFYFKKVCFFFREEKRLTTKYAIINTGIFFIIKKSQHDKIIWKFGSYGTKFALCGWWWNYNVVEKVQFPTNFKPIETRLISVLNFSQNLRI